MLLEKWESEIVAREACYDDHIRKDEAQYVRRVAAIEEGGDQWVQSSRATQAKEYSEKLKVQEKV